MERVEEIQTIIYLGIDDMFGKDYPYLKAGDFQGIANKIYEGELQPVNKTDISDVEVLATDYAVGEAENEANKGKNIIDVANDGFIAGFKAASILPRREADKELMEALKEIAKGEGAYSDDKLEHAQNTITNMIEIAIGAIRNNTKNEEK